MKFVVLLGVAAAGYGIAYDGAGLSNGASAAIGWAAGFVALGIYLLVSRRRSYRAAWTVETWRARAVQMREDNPELYDQILAQAQADDETAVAAHRDPDAYVALWLAAANDTAV